MNGIKNLVAFPIFIALLFNGCGKEEDKNKAEIALARLPYATLDEETVNKVFQFLIWGVPHYMPRIDIYTKPPYPMEWEAEEDNCPRITDNSSGSEIYILNQGDCTDKWGFTWTGRARFEGTHNPESGEFNLKTTYENFGFTSEGVSFANTGAEHAEGRYSSEEPFSFDVQHTININSDITNDSRNTHISYEGFEGMSGDATGFTIEEWVVYNGQYPEGEGAYYETINGNIQLFDPKTPDYRYDDVARININVEFGGEGIIPYEYFISGEVKVAFKEAIYNIRCGGELPDSGSMLITAGLDRAEIIFDDDCNGCFEWRLNDVPRGQICK